MGCGWHVAEREAFDMTRTQSANERVCDCSSEGDAQVHLSSTSRSGCRDQSDLAGPEPANATARTIALHGARHRPAISEAMECHARKDRQEQMDVDEIYFGKQMKFITVVTSESGLTKMRVSPNSRVEPINH
jgi:hypothetical protein